MTWAICFDFPQETEPVFAAEHAGVMTFTPALGEARRFATESAAAKVLRNRFVPKLAQWGAVVEVER